MKNGINLFIVAFALMNAAAAMAAGDGHCGYTMENMYTPQSYKVCQMPTDATECEEIGNTDDNANAVYGDGQCPADGAVGTCDMGESKVTYYEGDPSGLEIGCGFSSGDWVNAG